MISQSPYEYYGKNRELNTRVIKYEEGVQKETIPVPWKKLVEGID